MLTSDQLKWPISTNTEVLHGGEKYIIVAADYIKKTVKLRHASDRRYVNLTITKE